MRGSLRWRRGTTGNMKTRSSAAVKSHQCHESREAVLSSSGVGGWGLFFSPSLIIVLTQVREFIRLDPPSTRQDDFVPLLTMCPTPRINVDRKGGEDQHHPTPKSGNALHCEASGATVRPLVPFHRHDCRQTDLRGTTKNTHCRTTLTTLDMWHPRAPTQGLVGVGRIEASQYRTMRPLGTGVSSSPSRPWFHACRLCGRCGRCSVVRIGLQCCGNARSVGASVGGRRPKGRSPHGLAEWHKRLPPRLGGFASSWSARGRRHTGNGHGRLISPVHQRRRADHRRRPRK